MDENYNDVNYTENSIDENYIRKHVSLILESVVRVYDLWVMVTCMKIIQRHCAVMFVRFVTRIAVACNE